MSESTSIPSRTQGNILIIGSPGSGKSSVLRCLGALDETFQTGSEPRHRVCVIGKIAFHEMSVPDLEEVPGLVTFPVGGILFVVRGGSSVDVEQLRSLQERFGEPPATLLAIRKDDADEGEDRSWIEGLEARIESSGLDGDVHAVPISDLSRITRVIDSLIVRMNLQPADSGADIEENIPVTSVPLKEDPASTRSPSAGPGTGAAESGKFPQARGTPQGQGATDTADVTKKFEPQLKELGQTVSDFFIRMERTPRAILIGSASCGKSRLFNILAGDVKSKVSARANTTREPLTIDLMGLKLTDTPAVSSSAELEDSKGFFATQGYGVADAFIYVVNAAGRLTDADHDMIDWLRARRPTIVVLNKADILSEEERNRSITALEAALMGSGIRPLPVSSKSGVGIAELFSSLSGFLARTSPALKRKRSLTSSGPRLGTSTPSASSEIPDGDETSSILPAMILIHAVIAAGGVILLELLPIVFPFSRVIVVGFIQYALLGRIARRVFPEEGLHEPFRMIGTSLGAGAFFILSGKLAWILPYFNPIVAFFTTLAIGFIGLRAGAIVDRYLPRWARKLIVGREFKKFKK